VSEINVSVTQQALTPSTAQVYSTGALTGRSGGGSGDTAQARARAIAEADRSARTL